MEGSATRRLRPGARLAVALAAAALGGCDSEAGGRLNPPELEAIRQADQAYAAAWLGGDPDDVMATFTTDPMIAPSGMQPMSGVDALREFWWPAGSPATTVTEFTLVQDEVDGRADLAFVRGSFTLRFEYDGNRYANGGHYVSILRRDDGGAWRIARRMWSDQPRTVE